MTLILSGTDGLSDVDGSAATPAIRGTDANTGIFFPAADTIAFSEGGVESMRIDASGNMGLGVTPSAWGSGFKALQIGARSAFFDSSTTTLLGNNTYYDGSNYKYIATAGASLYDTTAGLHRWYNAPSGTAGNTVSFTQAMTLDASGNLGIGQTSPASRLHVQRSDDGVIGTFRGTSSAQLLLSVSSGNLIYDSSNGNTTHVWQANTVERARIDSSGNLLVGGTSTAALDGVFGAVIGGSSKSSAGVAFETSAQQFLIYQATAGSSGLLFYDSTNNTERARIGPSGGLAISQGLSVGTPTVYTSSIFFASAVLSAGAGTYPLRWNSSTGIVTYDTSSRLVKENIEDSPYGLAEVLQLKSRKYHRTDDQRDEIGLVADEVQAVMPEFVPLVAKSIFTKDEADTELIAGGVNYDKLTSVLVKAIQEQQAIITQLQADVAALKGTP